MSIPFPPATLALADGTIFKARAFGALKTTVAEVVFNTSMTGYQEILTDPSYCGQFVVMTAPQIGNVGVNPDDVEAERPWVSGLFVRELSRVVSNYRAVEALPDYLARHDIPGLTDLDTRALVRHIRTQGAMMAALSSEPNLSHADLVEMARTAPPMAGRNLVQEVTCPQPYHWTEKSLPEWQIIQNRKPVASTRSLLSLPKGSVRSLSEAEGSKIVNPKSFRVIAYDFGIKHNILRLLTEAGCDVTVVPAVAPATDVLAMKPDGVFLSNGPGDPAAVSYAIETVKELAQTDIPIFGICLGHQILALALGGRTHKMKFGHRGGNQPVQEGGETGPVAITCHNHGFAVTSGSLPADVDVTHLNLNDQCVEGLRHQTKPVFSVQYHPEASPGPHDAIDLFERFAASMMERRAK